MTVENLNMTETDLGTAVPALVGSVAGVSSVELRGSRQRGDANEFSDWDFIVLTNDFDRAAAALPLAVDALSPLVAQWDRLSDEPCFMLLLPGPVKVDLIFDGLTHVHEPPWTADPSTLAGIDGLFWDWTLWLASKMKVGMPVDSGAWRARPERSGRSRRREGPVIALANISDRRFGAMPHIDVPVRAGHPAIRRVPHVQGG